MAAEREVAGVDVEAEAAAEGSGERGEDIGGHLNYGAAGPADEVVVGVVGEVVDGGTVPEVHVLDYPEIRQRVERAVDGGTVHVRVGGLHPVGEVLGGDVSVGVEQRGHDRPPRRGEPSAPLADQLQDFVDSVVRHRLTLLRPRRTCGTGDPLRFLRGEDGKEAVAERAGGQQPNSE